MMSENKSTEAKWALIESIEDIEERIILIDKDVKKKRPLYRVLAKENPYRLYLLLGGDECEIELYNWAKEYTYEDYLEDSGEEYDSDDEEAWDIEEKSIEHAQDTGVWYVTGSCLVSGPNNIELVFEVDYCEGYFDSVIGTPYNIDAHGNHGILFY